MIELSKEEVELFLELVREQLDQLEEAGVLPSNDEMATFMYQEQRLSVLLLSVQ